MVIFVAAIFILAVVYSVFSATTISSSAISTDGTLSVTGISTLTGAVYASSTLQATGDGLFYDQLSAGASTNTPTTTFNVTGSGYFTAGLGVGYATTGSGNLLVNNLAVINGRLGVSGTSSPALEFGVTGSGLFSGGLGVGYATTSGLKVVGLGVFNNRLGVNGTSSPYQEFGVSGDAALSSAATTTISAESTSATQGGCIELEQPSSADEQAGTPGTWIRIYPGRGSLVNASSTNSSIGLVIERGRCQ